MTCNPIESAALVTPDETDLVLYDMLLTDGIAMLAFEASGLVSEWSAPELVVSLGGQDVFSYRIPLSITFVDEMYRYLNLRGAEAGGAFAPDMPSEPGNLPDAERVAENNRSLAAFGLERCCLFLCVETFRENQKGRVK